MTLDFLWNFHYVVQGYHDIPISKDFLSSPSTAWKVFTYPVKIRLSHLLFPPEVFKIKNSRRISLTVCFFRQKLLKRLVRQGPLNIWTEHSNWQIHRLYWYPIFSWFFLWNYFSMHIKAEGMTQFDIFHVFIENSVKSKLCFFWALLKPTKIWNLSKNANN